MRCLFKITAKDPEDKHYEESMEIFVNHEFAKIDKYNQIVELVEKFSDPAQLGMAIQKHVKGDGA